jgi:hypothetical protein
MSALAACIEIAKAQRVAQGPSSCVYVPRPLHQAACNELQEITGCMTSCLQIGQIFFYAQ